MFVLTQVTPSMETTPCDSPLATPRAAAPALTPRAGMSPYTNISRGSAIKLTSPKSETDAIAGGSARPLPPPLPSMPRLDRAVSTSDIDNDRAKIPGISSAGIMGGRVHKLVKSPSMNLQVKLLFSNVLLYIA